MMNNMEHITIDEFGKIDIRVGRILLADVVLGSEKLLKLSVDFGEPTPRQVVSGIRVHMPLQDLVGRMYLFVTNLKPRMIMGMESQAMILAVGSAEEPFSLFAPVNTDVVVGARIH